MTDDEKKTINEMIEAAVYYFRKRRAKEKRALDPRSVYEAFQDAIASRLRVSPAEAARPE